MIFGLLVNLGDIFKHIQELFPIANSGYLQQSFGAFRAGEAVAPPPVDATHALVVIAAWLLGLAVIAGAVLRLRDIT